MLSRVAQLMEPAIRIPPAAGTIFPSPCFVSRVPRRGQIFDATFATTCLLSTSQLFPRTSACVSREISASAADFAEVDIAVPRLTAVSMNAFSAGSSGS